MELDPGKTEAYLAFAILSTLASVIIALIILVMRKRITLVVQLFKESGNAISRMPFLLVEPLLVSCITIYRCLMVDGKRT